MLCTTATNTSNCHPMNIAQLEVRSENAVVEVVTIAEMQCAAAAECSVPRTHAVAQARAHTDGRTTTKHNASAPIYWMGAV